MTRTNASPDRDLFLAALVDDAADGQRVLWVGDARSRGPAALAERAERVVVLDTREDAIFDDSDEGDDTRGELLIRPFADGPPSDPYDVAVVTELGVFRNLRQALERLERLVGDGLLVLVTDTHSGLEPEFVQDCVRDVFGAGRWFGQSGFVGDTVAELGAGEVQGAAVDAGLLTDTPPLARFIAVVGSERDRLPGYLVVQTAGLGAGVSAFASEDDRLDARDDDRDDEDDEDDDDRRGEPAGDDVEDLAELREQLEASEDYAEEVERALAARDAALARAEDELDALREQLARITATPEPALGADGDAYDAIEERLREVGRRASALEQEVERRGTLVRDAVEEAARLRRELARERTDGPSGALLPVAAPVSAVVPLAVVERPSDLPTPREHAKLAAELDAARFENDALRIALDSAANERAAALELVEAELLGRVRGLRARVAEVSELHESARALLALAEADTADARERERRLQAEIGQLRERFEFELIRARSAEREPVALPDEVREHIARLERSEAHLSQRVSALSLQLAAARDLAEGAPFEGRLRALTGEVSGLRFRLDERERALAALRSAAPVATSAPAPEVSAPVAAPETGNAEVEAELTARLRAANDAIDGMRTQLGLKDGLITRLQLELSDNEGVARTSESDAHRLRDENERMREALLAASAAVDERDALQREVETLSKSVVEPGRIYTLERARDEAKAAAEAALQELLAARAEAKKLAAASDASEALKA
jgi:predicted  nucleic acid-binding Zn-ribbon protein